MAAAFGHEIPLNACVVNSAPLRSGCSPALGAYGTAHAVCSLLGAAARGEVSISPHAISQQMGVEGSMIFGDRVWGRGMQRYVTRGGGGADRDPAPLFLNSHALNESPVALFVIMLVLTRHSSLILNNLAAEAQLHPRISFACLLAHPLGTRVTVAARIT